MGNVIGAGANGGRLPNGWGITVWGAEHNFIQANLVAHNVGEGITINPGSGNRIHHNAIAGNGAGTDKGKGKGNSSDAGLDSRWDDGSEGNYWSDYPRQDRDGDGIGDTPYPVPPNGVDRYPLMKPEESLG